MILVTVGTHGMPFDRLLRSLDAPAVVAALDPEPLVVQAGTSRYVCRRARQFPYCPRAELDTLLREADLVISHGGIGTLLPAVRQGKHVIAIPRLAAHGEHNDDHQVEICAELARQGALLTSTDVADLPDLLGRDRAALRPFAPPSTVAASIRTELAAFERVLARRAARR